MIAGAISDRAPVVQKPSGVVVSGRNHWQTAEAKNTRRQPRAGVRVGTSKTDVKIGRDGSTSQSSGAEALAGGPFSTLARLPSIQSR
jgi:hypothetical protein